MSMTAAVKDVAKKPRGKKGDGPVVVSYITSKNEESSRVSADVEQIKVADRHGKSKLYPVSVVGAATLKQLAAFAFAKQLDLYIRNTTDGKDVLACADAKVASLKEGRFYSKGEGKGGQGRTFDYDLIVDTAALTADVKSKAGKLKKNGEKHKPATQTDLDRLRLKLMSYATGRERKEFIDKHLMVDGVFKTHYLNLKHKRELAKAKEMGTDEEDALSAF